MNGAPNDAEPSTSYPAAGPFRLRASCKGHSKAIASVRFSPSGKLLATASADQSFKLWSIPDGVLQEAPNSIKDDQIGSNVDQSQQHKGGLNDVAWNCSNTYLATASDDLTAKLWDVETQKCLSTLTGHTNYVSCCQFNPAGTILATGSYDETVRFWDVQTGRCLRELPVHCDPVTGMDYHPDGTVLATCSFDGMLRLWDTSTGHCLRTQAIDNGDSPIGSVRFSPNGKYLLLCTLNNSVRLLGVEKGNTLRMYRGLVSKLYCVQAAFMHTLPQQTVVSGSEDGSMFVWGLNSKQVIQRIPATAAVDAAGPGQQHAVLSVDAHPQLPLLASGGLGDDSSAYLWSADGSC